MAEANTQLERLAESALLKLVAPATCTLMLTLGGWGINRVTDRLDRLETLLNAQQAERLVLQRDVEMLKAQAAQRGEAISNMHDQILKLQFDTQQLQQRGQHQ
jgi:hypothetical protein